MLGLAAVAATLINCRFIQLPARQTLFAIARALVQMVLVAPAMIAVVGQLIGGAMTAANLAGRRLHQELEQRSGEVEAALALGFSTRDARNLVVRPVASEALLPGIDQTRTVGTVTLPGAFVGLVLGGASPLEVGLVQLIVLVNLMVVQGICVAVSAELIERRIGERAVRQNTKVR